MSTEEAQALVDRIKVVATWHNSKQRQVVETIAADVGAALGLAPPAQVTPPAPDTAPEPPAAPPAPPAEPPAAEQTPG